MISNLAMLKKEVTNIGSTNGGASLSIVQPSDSVGGANNKLTLETHKFSVTQ